MTAFEFFTVLLSFVVSLGVASLLGAVARLMQEARRVKFSLAYALWAAMIFNLQVTFWLKSWSYHSAFELRVSTSFPPLVLAILAFFVCALATPQIPVEGEIDLREFHERQVRKYASMVAAFMLMAAVQGYMMQDIKSDPTQVSVDALFQVVFAGVAVLAAIFRRVRWLQIIVPAAFLVASPDYYGRLIGW